MGRIFEKRKYSIFKTAAQNSKLYSKYSKQLYMAAKNGVPDPNGGQFRVCWESCGVSKSG